MGLGFVPLVVCAHLHFEEEPSFVHIVDILPCKLFESFSEPWKVALHGVHVYIAALS